jgi:hypothetical protein
MFYKLTAFMLVVVIVGAVLTIAGMLEKLSARRHLRRRLKAIRITKAPEDACRRASKEASVIRAAQWRHTDDRS